MSPVQKLVRRVQDWRRNVAHARAESIEARRRAVKARGGPKAEAMARAQARADAGLESSRRSLRKVERDLAVIRELRSLDDIVAFDGVPVRRSIALVLGDARAHGQHFTVSSGNRDRITLNAYKLKHRIPLSASPHDQEFLYDHQHEPGYYPANKPGTGSHEGRSDGNGSYRIPASAKIPPWMEGTDCTSAGERNSCSALVTWMQHNGYDARRIYPTPSEAHHFSLFVDPRANLIKRGLLG